MGKLNAEKMIEIETARAKQLEKLRVLTSTPFNYKNTEHTKALKQYVDNFELSANKMYLFQAMSTGLTTGVGTWFLGLILPIPGFIKDFLTAFLYIGVTGFILERFSMTDFYNQLTVIKDIYNWCLKGSSVNYSTAIDNTDKLLHPDIQRMIKLIAPLCSTDFMLAWPKEAKHSEQKGAFYTTLSSGYAAVSSAFSIFSSSSASNVNINRIRELKMNVETRHFDVETFGGLEQSIKYFATSSDFRALIAANVKGTVETAKNVITGNLSLSRVPS